MHHHLTFVSRGRCALWTNPAQLLRLTRAVVAIGRGRVLLFCVVDDHVHVVLEGDRPSAGAYARAANHALRRLSGQPLFPTDLRPVEDRTHLVSLIDYVHRQPLRHALGVHPAAWAGSSLWDHLGARQLPGFDPGALRQALPRLTPSRLWESVGMHPPTSPSPTEVVGTLGLPAVHAACGAALAVSTGCPARDRADAAALTLQVARAAGASSREVVVAIRCAERTLRRHRARPVDPDRAATATRHLALQVALRQTAPPQPNDSERRALERSRLLAGSDPP